MSAAQLTALSGEKHLHLKQETSPHSPCENSVIPPASYKQAGGERSHQPSANLFQKSVFSLIKQTRSMYCLYDQKGKGTLKLSLPPPLKNPFRLPPNISWPRISKLSFVVSPLSKLDKLLGFTHAGPWFSCRGNMQICLRASENVPDPQEARMNHFRKAPAGVPPAQYICCRVRRREEARDPAGHTGASRGKTGPWVLHAQKSGCISSFIRSLSSTWLFISSYIYLLPVIPASVF